jgi:cytochrome c oxidase assembly protein subunit 15
MMNIKNFSFFAIFFAFVVIALGAWTRLVDAGLGCPDWPGCYGFVFFPTSGEEIAIAESRFPMFPYEIDKAIPEVVHRYFAAALGLIAIALMVTAYRTGAAKHIKSLTTFLFFFICLQGLFGYLTVSLKLLPIVVTGHLFGGFITLSLFFYVFLHSSGILSKIHIPQLRGLALTALALLIIQIFLGAWTSTNYASLACADFPTCHGSYWPNMDFKEGFNLFHEVGPNYLYGQLENDARTAIHYMHRLNAILVALVYAFLIYKLFQFGAGQLSAALGIVLITQISLGIMNVVFVLPLYVAIAHNLVAAMLLLTSLSALYITREHN